MWSVVFKRDAALAGIPPDRSRLFAMRLDLQRRKPMTTNPWTSRQSGRVEREGKQTTREEVRMRWFDRGSGAAVLGAVLALNLAAAGRVAAQAQQSVPRVESAVTDLRFVPLSDLPRAPERRATRDACNNVPVPARSEAARSVAERGWSITGETALGRYRAVSFAGSLGRGPSGTCLIGDGNVGVFDGQRLVALIYGRDGAQRIGRIGARDDGTVRIWDGDVQRLPVGDLTVHADGSLLLASLPSEDTVCGGRGSVPAITTMPIDKARAALIAKGWTPIRGAPSPDSREQDLARQGIIEVDSWSGTGLAYCAFAYTGPAGRLSVTTIGDAEMPEVSAYEVTCR
jgi:hypothetical protein